MPPSDERAALNAAREWLFDQRLLRVAPATQDCLATLILRRERETQIKTLQNVLEWTTPAENQRLDRDDLLAMIRVKIARLEAANAKTD